MHKFNDNEILILDTFRITPNIIRNNTWKKFGIKKLKPKDIEKILNISYNNAKKFLSNFQEKLLKNNSILDVPLGIWLLSHYMTEEELLEFIVSENGENCIKKYLYHWDTFSFNFGTWDINLIELCTMALEEKRGIQHILYNEKGEAYLSDEDAERIKLIQIF